MYRCERLTYKKLNNFKKLNDNRLTLNSLNEDFFSIFYQKNFLQKVYMLNNVKLLLYKNEVVGSIWCEKLQRRHYVINSVCISDDYHYVDGLSYLINSYKSNTILTYNCERNNFNYSLLEKLGFIKEQGTMELSRDINSYESLYLDQDTYFENFQKGNHEKVRCKLQNDIFQQESREPLTLEDIYYDIHQDYYIEDGSVFIKYKNEYIGYGQIILDEGIPTIVNFGIVKPHRKKGYGKLLLKRLFNLVHEKKYNKVKIKVYTENYTALNLYITLGFVKMKEYYKWNYYNL